MKKLIFLLLFILLNSLNISSQTNKLPKPEKSFIEIARKTDEPEEKYFTNYLGKKSERILKRFSESKDVCAKEYEFKTGIKWKTNSCSEVGTEAEITFPNYSKKDIVSFVEWFFQNEDNKWNKLKTKYQPKEEGVAGCYLEIKELKGKIVLSYYCGC